MRQYARGSRALSLAAVGALAAAGVLGAAVPAHAATTTTVSGILDFLLAVDAANANPGEDVILLDAATDEDWGSPSSVIVDDDLRVGRAPGSGNVTFVVTPSAFVVGPGTAFTASGFRIHANADAGIVAASGADVRLTDMEVSGAATRGIDQSGGTLAATRVTFSGNGTGVRALDMDAVTLDHVTVAGNSLGLDLGTSGGTIGVADSTISDNGLSGPLRAGMALSATDGGTITVDRTTIRGNRGPSGAGVRIGTLHDGSDLIIRDSTISGNTSSGSGGGIASVDPPSGFAIDTDSTIRIERTLIGDNQAADTGGGLALTALRPGTTLNIAASTIRDNRAFIAGGAAVSFIHNGSDPAVVVDSSTFSGNTAQGSVGGLLLECDDEAGPGTVDIVNSTFSGNGAGQLASAIGAGCDQADGLLVRVRNSTVSANSGTVAAVAIIDVEAELSNSIIGGNQYAVDLDAAGAERLTVDYTLIESPDPTASTAMAVGVGNLPGVAPDLGPLASNGGPTQTHLPLDGGDLIDAGDPAFAAPPANDQRGEPRIVRVLDLGAVELAASPPAGSPGAVAELPATGGPPAVSAFVPVLAVVAGAMLVAFTGVRRRRLERPH